MDVRQEPSRGDGEINLAHEQGFALGPLSVSPSTREVRRAGVAEIIEPRVMQALVCLVRAEGAVVSRDDLIRRCWGGRIVGDDAINRCVSKVRQIADTPDGHAFVIEAIPRVGYRLRRATEPEAVPLAPESAAVVPAAAPLKRPASAPQVRSKAVIAAAIATVAIVVFFAWTLLRHKPEPPPLLRSVAILPIQNLTGDPSLDAAVDRLTEDVMLVSGRGGYIIVAPRNATFAWKGKAVDERMLGRELHVRNIVAASLRKAEPGWRVSFQVVDATTGQVEASHDFGRAAAEGALPEGQLALSLFNAIAPVVRDRWQVDQLAKPPDDRDPENLVARVEKLMDDGRREDIPKVERLIETAQRTIPKDHGLLPDFLQSACWYYSEGLVRRGYYRSPEQRTAWAKAALDFANEAGRLRPVMTGPHSCRAEALAQLERWDEGLAEARYVIETAPLTASGYEAKARLEFARGWFRDALKDFTELVDRDSDEDKYGDVGVAHLFLNEYDVAIADLRRQAASDPKNPAPPFFLSAALELSGHHEDAVLSAELYGWLKADDGVWEMLAQSHEPAFLAQAALMRRALHEAGLDPPSG